MVTKYAEICEVVQATRKSEDEYRDRCWKYMGTLLSGFLSYCAIPQERVMLLKWNGLRGDASKFTAPEDAGIYSMAGATVLDEDGFWRLGLRISFGSAAIAFAFWVGEQDGGPITKIADKTWKLDFSNQHQCEEFYDEVVRRVKEGLR